MRACKRFAAFGAALFTIFAAFSQDGLEMPDMPAMPKMPSVSGAMQMPEVNMPSAPDFYVPSFEGQKTNQMQTGNNTANQSASAEKNTDSANGSASATESKKSDSKSQLLNSLKKELLTAGDISSLYDSGVFGNISSIYGVSDTGAGAAGDNSSVVLLQKILESLEELKKVQQNESPEQKLNLANQQLDSQTFKNREPKILRFKINGYNVNDSITKVFFSDSEPDGTFLLSADRTYYVNRQTRTETFYILFKAVKSRGSAVTYEVRPSVVQDAENTNSFVYRFAGIKDLVAEKTGNLVALHSVSGDLNVDLLLDIDGEK